MKMIIDRFEGEFAVVELPDGKCISLPKCLFPKEAKEGSVVKIVVCEDESKAAEDSIKQLMDEVWADETGQ